MAEEPVREEDVCFARYSAWGRAGVIGGGGAMSAFLSYCGNEEEVEVEVEG